MGDQRRAADKIRQTIDALHDEAKARLASPALSRGARSERIVNEGEDACGAETTSQGFAGANLSYLTQNQATAPSTLGLRTFVAFDDHKVEGRHALPELDCFLILGGPPTLDSGLIGREL